MKTCVNGCAAPIQPPSKVLCRKCMDAIGEKMEAMLAEMKRRSKKKGEDK